MRQPIDPLERRNRRPLVAVLPAVILAACGSQPPAPAAPSVTNQVIVAPTPVAPARKTANQLLPLPNGIVTYLEVTPRGAEAQVQLAVLAGSLFVAPGLAELAANVLMESSDPSDGRASLRHRIEALGGHIKANIGLMTTWFDIRIEPYLMPKAIIALRESLESITQSRSQIDRMRDELVASLSSKLQAQPISTVANLLLRAEPSSGHYINSMLDLDPSKVSLFQNRLYRPERCLLAISSPQHLPDIQAAILEPAATSIAAWAPPAAVTGPDNVLDQEFQSGLYWANEDGQPDKVKVAIVMQLPNETTPNAAEWLAMHSCLTLGGRGGRLERLQDDAGLPQIMWQTDLERTPDAVALVMSAVVEHDQAAILWRVLNQARKSLVDAPPSDSELQLAIRRAQLEAQLPGMSDSDGLRIAANLKTRMAAPDALAARLSAMNDSSSWDANKAAIDFQKTPAWMIVIGPGRPENTTGIVAFDIHPRGFVATSKTAPTAAAIASTEPWLTRARAAMGGGESFGTLTGFSARGTIVADKSPDVTDTITWNQSGKLTRARQIIGQTITTELDGAKASELMDKVRKSLSAREAKLLRHEMIRHPLMLLAENKRGNLQFRPIGQRIFGDRELMVIEAIDSDFDRLRVHIDIESYLIRTVESWERLPDETLAHVRENWSDYRDSGPVRAPFRRRTTWNDGEHQTETAFSEWRPILSR